MRNVYEFISFAPIQMVSPNKRLMIIIADCQTTTSPFFGELMNDCVCFADVRAHYMPDVRQILLRTTAIESSQTLSQHTLLILFPSFSSFIFSSSSSFLLLIVFYFFFCRFTSTFTFGWIFVLLVAQQPHALDSNKCCFTYI